MHTPEDMMQELVSSVGGVVELLPIGSYTSGTYTIPNSGTWEDFSVLYYLTTAEDMDDPPNGRFRVLEGSMLFREQFSNTGWDYPFVLNVYQRITYVSSTQFSVYVDTAVPSEYIVAFYGYKAA